MKKSLIVLMALLMVFSFAACGGGSGSDDNASEEATQEEPQVLDLTGTWKQTNSGDGTMYHEAVIEGEEITINWIDTEDDSKSLYWAGSYIPPTEPGDEYTWDSVNDTEQTDMALLASGDETKTFSYKDGVLSYEASAMGTTKTIKMEKQ